MYTVDKASEWNYTFLLITVVLIALGVLMKMFDSETNPFIERFFIAFGQYLPTDEGEILRASYRLREKYQHRFRMFE